MGVWEMADGMPYWVSHGDDVTDTTCKIRLMPNVHT